MRIFAQDRAFAGFGWILATIPKPLGASNFCSAWSAHGLTLAASLALLGLARSTHHDWRSRFERGGMRGLAPRSSRPLTHPGRQWTAADALRVFAIRREMRWCGKARLRLEHNLRHPDKPLRLAAMGRIVQWGLKAGRINPEGIGEANPCPFWCEGRAKARHRRSFAGGHAERWRLHDGELNCKALNMALIFSQLNRDDWGVWGPCGQPEATEAGPVFLAP